MGLTDRLAALISSSRATAPPTRGADGPSIYLIVFVLVWASAVGAGVVWIWDYKMSPGVASGPPASWPESTGLRRSGPTLVMTFHPRCTCSQASVTELARLMASLPQRPTVYALFVAARPSVTPLWERAAAIPGVTPIADPDGAIAKAFGAETSGDVIVYSPSGALVFHGGLTAARGHEGDSFGRQRLLAVLRGDTPDRRSSPVFGCPLYDEPNPRPDGLSRSSLE